MNSISNQNLNEQNVGSEAPGVTEFLDFLSRMNESSPQNEDDDEEDPDEEEMNADGYHNKAIIYSIGGNKKQAINICLEGLEHYPNNVVLLADTIMYCSESGDMDRAAQFFQIMRQTIPYRRWNWRAFIFSLDYLIEEDPIKNEVICREIIANCKKFLPFEERAYKSESELEAALGNTQRSIEVLMEAVDTHPNACQCALALADIQLEIGQYEEVVKTVNYGISASAEVQPSINIPYLLLVRTLAKDAMLHKKSFSGCSPNRKEVDEVSEEYNLLAEFSELKLHSKIINTRKKMLQFIKTVE